MAGLRLTLRSSGVAQQEVRRKRRDSTEIEAKLPELNQQKQLAITAKKFKACAK